MSDDDDDHYLYGEEEVQKTMNSYGAGRRLIKDDKNTVLNNEKDQEMSDLCKNPEVENEEEEEEESDSDIEFVIEMKPGQRAEPLSRPVPYSSVRVSGPTKNTDKGNLSTSKTELSTTKPPGVDVSHVAEWNGKSLYQLDMESLDDKPWRKPGADITDYFNYGFDEFTWTAYCAKQTGIREEFMPQKFMQMMEQMSGADMMSMAPNMQVMMAAGGFPGMQGISGMHPEMMPMMRMGMSDMTGFMMNMGQMGQMGQMGFQQFPPGLNSMASDSQSGQSIQGKQGQPMHNSYNMQSYGGYNQMHNQYNVQMQGSKPIPSGPKAHNVDGVKVLSNERIPSSGNHKQESILSSSKESHETIEPVSNSSQIRSSGRSNMQHRSKSTASSGGKSRSNH
ncbi:hypothetical protein PCANB_000914 [Pneumocystis canis]|nr:hypothetical protein PCANB_000914 [Pneumocystis canis]